MILALTAGIVSYDHAPIVLHPVIQSHKVRIDSLCVDQRGLISIMFTQDGKKWGLDYLTIHEYDSLISIY
jgi:hypothetical protein